MAARRLFQPLLVSRRSISTNELMKLCAQVNRFRFKIADNGNTALVTVPGLSYSDFDRSGQLAAWKIQNMVTQVRISAYNGKCTETGKTYLEFDKMSENAFVFFASAVMEVSREFYEIPKIFPQPELNFRLRLGHLGSTSVKSNVDMTCPKTGKQLLYNENQTVLIEKATRKPMKIPDWWLQKYSGAVDGNKKLQVARITPPDANVHKHEVLCNWADTDPYGHCGYFIYTMFCLEGANTAVKEKVYRQFVKNMTRYRVKRMEVQWTGEVVAGDRPVVHSWEHPNDPLALQFYITNKGKGVFEATMHFHAPDEGA